MKCTLHDICSKEIINIRSGTKIGFADDIEFDTDTLSVKSIIIYGKYHLFGFLGKDDDIVIKCKDIEVIGTDTILISADESLLSKKIKVKPEILCK
ncbi:MAG: YlmC/YmxH family sporulation protein [Oscillospiraceae bacterium]|nr:YlmC/YmxH family sporulation protein [Oscillospiraceae bacterium]